MTDADIINRIELKLSTSLKRGVGLYRGENSYSINENGQVTSLRVADYNRDYNNKPLGKGVDFDDIVTDIANLRNLLYLDLSRNGIEKIDPLKKLKNLKFLDLSSNSIEDIQPLGELTELNCLALSRNKIVDILPLSNCKKIHLLFLLDNLVQEIPVNILNNLIFGEEKYDLIQTQFAKNHFVHIQRFEEAALSRDAEKFILEHSKQFITPGDGNYKLYDKFSRLTKEVFISNNPLINPPFEIIRQGKKAVKNYLDQIQREDGKTQRLFEAKLLVVGQGGTGKTTFVRKIQNANAAMLEDKDTTLGIEIGRWVYMIDFPIDQQPAKVQFHVNLWDFGGQRIYQGTHQIFFTDKSFYVLLADSREEKTDFSYWLNTVEQLGGNASSLIIVLNKKYGHEQKFDESGYTKHFGNLIKKVFHLDLKNDINDIIVLQELVKVFLKQLPGIGDALPISWVEIRNELSKEGSNFISFDRFREICDKYNISDFSIIRTLSEYFSRIGVFTHYIDDIVLQERIYLNSNWLVKTVYEVLDNDIAKSRKGRLTISDIRNIWGKNELQYEINKLTQLMHKFGLMYHIPNSEEYVVPAHLSTETPYLSWPHANSEQVLQFVYEFDKYMPQGIMSRLIVSLHHHIKDHDFVWHRGVNIECNGAYAEILESYGGNNRFEIHIAGINKIELLAIIRERFAEVLKPFNKLNYKQLVPCVCDECRGSSQPAFHDFNLLLKFREKGTGSQCSHTGEVISAEKLLRTIELQKIETKPGTTDKWGIKTIKIFLASSSELIEDRRSLREFISVENDRYHEKGIYLKIIQWEYFVDSISKERLQEEYNKALKESDIFLSLFFTKVGRYTSEEFENAFGQFKNTGKPYIYTYFKDAPVSYNQIAESDISSKFEFEKRLENLGHFKTIYKNMDDLKNQFRRQLEDLILTGL
jgi:internalin A